MRALELVRKRLEMRRQGLELPPLGLRKSADRKESRPEPKPPLKKVASKPQAAARPKRIPKPEARPRPVPIGIDDVKWQVYSLADPRSGLVRYVGITVDLASRIRGHMLHHDSSAKSRWLRSLRASGLNPQVAVLESGRGRGAAEAERMWISHFRKVSGRLLTNASPGGYDLRPRGWVPGTDEDLFGYLSDPDEPGIPLTLFDLTWAFGKLLERAEGRARRREGATQGCDKPQSVTPPNGTISGFEENYRVLNDLCLTSQLGWRKFRMPSSNSAPGLTQ